MLNDNILPFHITSQRIGNSIIRFNTLRKSNIIVKRFTVLLKQHTIEYVSNFRTYFNINRRTGYAFIYLYKPLFQLFKYTLHLRRNDVYFASQIPLKGSGKLLFCFGIAFIVTFTQFLVIEATLHIRKFIAVFQSSPFSHSVYVCRRQITPVYMSKFMYNC